MILFMHLVLATFVLVLGMVVGSFLNVCIYRIPWEKSIIWPGSTCLRCLEPIAPKHHVPVVSWFALGGKCQSCGAPFSPRYACVEALTGLLFLGVYLVDVAQGASLLLAPPLSAFATMVYHLALIALLLVAGFIDYDLFIIPDSLTVTGMLLGLAGGLADPGLRPEPATAATRLGGLGMGLQGLLIGGGLVLAVRFLGTLAFRREAMGLGDVTLLGMIGAFLGWQAAVIAFVLAAFLGLVPALVKILLNIAKHLAGRKLSSADREIPFGPYLSMAAGILVLSWPWLWPGWGKGFFQTLSDVVFFLAN